MSGARNHLLVHLAPDKHSFYRDAPAIFWSDQLSCWITADPATMQTIQKDSAFRVLDQSAEIDRIKARLRIDLPNIARVLRSVPVNVEGDEHTERRRRMARVIAARTEAALARFSGLARELCGRHLAREGRCELVADLFEPLSMALAQALSGVSLAHDPGSPTPAQIFDRSLGLNRRKLIDAELRRLWQVACRNVSESEADEAIALAVLGSDTVFASLALSFAERVSSNPRARLGDIEWGDHLTASAVPFIERTASRTTELAGATIREGDLVRLFLDSYSLEPPDKRDGYFGTGRHACLGRPIAQRAWSALASVLRELPLFVRIDSVRYRAADAMFLFPSQIAVSVHEH